MLSSSNSFANMTYVPTSEISVLPPTVKYNETYTCEDCCGEKYNCVQCCTIMVHGIIPRAVDCEKLRFTPCARVRTNTYVYNELGNVWQRYGNSSGSENENVQETNGNQDSTSSAMMEGIADSTVPTASDVQNIRFREAVFFGSGVVEKIEMGYSLTTTVLFPPQKAETSPALRISDQIRLSLWIVTSAEQDQTVPTTLKPDVQVWESGWFSQNNCSLQYVDATSQVTGICSDHVVVTPSSNTWVGNGEYGDGGGEGDVRTNIVLKVELFINEHSLWYVHVDRAGIKVTTSGLHPLGFPSSGPVGVNTCKCSLGEYRDVVTQRCQLCPNGKYSDNEKEEANCKSCSAGRHTTWSLDDVARARQACSSCDAGTYQSEIGRASCIPCPVGKYNDEKGAVRKFDCLRCGLGKYGNAEDTQGGTSMNHHCLDCPQGKYNNDQVGAVSSQSCKGCPLGRYGTMAGAINPMQQCEDCDKGRYSNVFGAKNREECQKCERGYFSPSMGAIFCSSCVPGRFAEDLGQALCAQCPSGFFSTYTRSLLSDNFRSLHSCDGCMAGYYSYKNSSTECKQCAAGQWSQDVSTECRNCPSGQYGTDGGSCMMCPIGYLQDMKGQTACYLCPAGTFLTEKNKDSCEDCPAGWNQKNAGKLTCNECEVGMYSVPASQGCIQCAMGQYGSESKVFCDTCPAGYVSNEGATLCTVCMPGLTSGIASPPPCSECASGRFRTTNSVECVACAGGQYAAAAAASMCTFCSAGRHASNASSTCVACEPGRFSLIGRSVCTACPEGYKAEYPESHLCEVCSLGQYSASAASSCKLCALGMYAEQSKSNTCTKCLHGRFAADAGAKECFQCPLGYAAINSGAEVCRACRPGLFASNKSMSVCLKCIAGMFAVDYGSTQCKNCPAGKITASEGSGRCLDCLAGFYIPKTAATKDQCHKCKSGMYSSEDGSSICVLCPKGFKSRGLEMCEQCEAGTYSMNSGSLSCINCPSNWYQTNAGSDACIMCENGRFSAEGSRVKTLCTLASVSSTIEPPILSELRVENVSSNVLILVLESFPYFDDDKTLSKVKYVVVEWSTTSTFDEQTAGFGRVEILVAKATSRHQSIADAISVSIATPSHIIQRGVYLRARYKLYTVGVVSGWSTTLDPWNVARSCAAPHCCDAEHQYLRRYPHDDLRKSALPLFSAHEQSVRRCVACPVGASCRGSVTASDVIPKWGYWRVPWSNTDLRASFVQCVGKDDCIGAPGYDRAIELVALPNTYGTEGNLENQQQNVYSLRVCSALEVEFNNCSGYENWTDTNHGKGTSLQRIETCQAGRLPDGVACAVCAPNYMRSRNNCVQCFDSDLRVIVLCIGMILLFVLLCCFRICWHSIRKYRSASRDVLRIIIVNITLLQINNSLESMIPIEWPSSLTSWFDTFEVVDVDIMSLTGGTCISGMNFFTAFSTMSSLPFVILLFAALNFSWHRVTLRQTLNNMNVEEKTKRREHAYLEAFLLADEDGNSTLGANELIKVLNVELHLNQHNNGKYKLRHNHGLQLIQKLMESQAATELSLCVFLDAVSTGKMDRALESLQEVVIPSNESSREAILISIMRRNMFASSFMVAIHLLLVTHAPISKKVFMFYLCRNVAGKHYMHADYAIQCYDSDWNAFHPVVAVVLLLFTVGFPLVLCIALCWNQKRLYHRLFYAKMGFLYERYVRGVEWWEIHEMMRKIMLTGMLLFTSEKPMVRSVLATMICIAMCINLNYFKPHRNRIVFWVEQAANLSSTTKYLVAVVIAASDGENERSSNIAGSASSATADTSNQEEQMMGIILVAFDVMVMVVSVVASIACFVILRRSLKNVNNDKDNDDIENTKVRPVTSAFAVEEAEYHSRSSDLACARLTERVRNSGLKIESMEGMRISELTRGVEKVEQTFVKKVQIKKMEILKKQIKSKRMLQMRLQKRESGG